MAEYSIRIPNDDARDAIEAEIKTFGDQIRVKERSTHQIIFEANRITAQALSVKTEIEVFLVVHATTDMGMGESFLRNLQAAANKKLADIAIQHAKASPVAPVDGQPAERYVAQADPKDLSAAPASEVTDALKKADLRLHDSKIPTLSVIFFDVADPKKLESVTLPKGWTLEKISPPAP